MTFAAFSGEGMRLEVLHLCIVLRGCFGLTCPPYLVMEDVNSHLEAHQDRFPTMLDKMKFKIYVENLVVSCESLPIAKRDILRSSAHLHKSLVTALYQHLTIKCDHSANSVEPSAVEPQTGKLKKNAVNYARRRAAQSTSTKSFPTVATVPVPPYTGHSNSTNVYRYNFSALNEMIR
ncbi:conserved hypothetical protein [Trichinella spiralis]|uniref:hypothetical protein n=1 Tax=Trichinella spiralis TaxID=6334 RepID=UPI0001EFE450|nr:conserved hypothetical protein [Trichinella spiralis]